MKFISNTILNFLVLFCLLSLNISCSRSPEYPPQINQLKEDLARNPKNFALYEELIEKCYENGFYKESLGYSQKAQDLFSGKLLPYVYQGRAFEAMGQWGNARKAYQRVCKKFPDRSTGYYQLGVLDYKEGNYEESISNIKIFLTLTGPDTEGYIKLLNFLAKSYYYNDNIDQADATTERVLEIGPFNKEALYNLGTWKLRAGKNQEARDIFTKLIAQMPQDAEPYLRLGKTYYNLKDTANAEKTYWDASRYDSTVEILAKIVHAEDFGSIYKSVNTAIVKVIENYSYRINDTFYVKGIVENFGLEVAKRVYIIIRIYDRKDNVVYKEAYELSPRNLRPEQYAFFEISTPYKKEFFDVDVDSQWYKRSVDVYLK